MSDKKSFIDSPTAKWILAIATILSMSWGLFQTFHVKNPKLQYEIISQAKLFNKTEDISTVKMLVDTVDVLKGNQNISFYVVKIQNVGNQHLRWNDYDEGPFGIKVSNGKILQGVEFIEASADHIWERYHDFESHSTDYYIDVPKMTLDRKEWYTVSFSIIHNNDTLPSFIPVGKIVGQKQMVVISSQESGQLSFREMVINGSLWINVARAFFFLIIWIVVIMIVMIIVPGLSDAIRKKKAKRVLEQIIKDASISGYIRDDYLKNNDINISLAKHYYGLGNKQLNKSYINAIRYLSDFKNVETDDFDDYLTMYRDINHLIKIRYLMKNNKDELSIPRDAKDAVDKILDVLGKYDMDIRFLNSRYYSMYNNIEVEGMDDV